MKPLLYQLFTSLMGVIKLAQSYGNENHFNKVVMNGIKWFEHAHPLDAYLIGPHNANRLISNG